MVMGLLHQPANLAKMKKQLLKQFFVILIVSIVAVLFFSFAAYVLPRLYFWMKGSSGFFDPGL